MERILEGFWQAVNDDADPRIKVISAWVDRVTSDESEALCVTFVNRAQPAQAGITVGLRWIPMTAFDGSYRELDIDESRYGALLYFDCVTEPLGRFLSMLRYDKNGIGWMGMLGDELPEIPVGG